MTDTVREALNPDGRQAALTFIRLALTEYADDPEYTSQLCDRALRAYVAALAQPAQPEGWQKGEVVKAWWWAESNDAELYNGPFAAKEDAIASAHAEEEAGEDHSARVLFFGGNRPLGYDCFDAEQVLENFEEYNEECFGEDGPLPGATPEQERELEVALGFALRTWNDRHKAIRPWVVSPGHEEPLPPAPAPTDTGRG